MIRKCSSNANGLIYVIDWLSAVFTKNLIYAAVVEWADTRDLKSLGSDTVPVQVRSAAPFFKSTRAILCFLFL